MRDWLLVLPPLAIAAYFIYYPNEWWALVYWLQGLLQ